MSETAYQRIEVITGPARRRRWSTEQKLRIIEETRLEWRLSVHHPPRLRRSYLRPALAPKRWDQTRVLEPRPSRTLTTAQDRCAADWRQLCAMLFESSSLDPPARGRYALGATRNVKLDERITQFRYEIPFSLPWGMEPLPTGSSARSPGASVRSRSLAGAVEL